MADVKGIVTKKIGPLPVWAYVVGGAAAVFLLGRFRGGSSSSGGGAADVIRIPTLAAGSPSTVDDGAMGSPGQNAQGGMDTQPGGAPPWWSSPPAWWGAGTGGGQDTANTPGGGGNTGLQSSASSGRRPADAFSYVGKTAAAIAEAGRLGFERISPTAVSTGGNGVVAPTNVIKGFADPVTGNLEAQPGPGRVPIYG